MTRDFDARNERKSRSVCAAMAESADTGKRALSEKERRILGMWPRFEDGEYVWYGDEVDNMRSTVIAVEFFDGAITLSSDFDHLHLSFGERVKRPAPEVLDADGVPIQKGDTVWHCNGLASGVVMSIDAGSLMHTIRYVDESGTEFRDAARNLTHTRPDSWERLEEDAAKNPCDYAEVVKGSRFDSCSDCPWWEEYGGRSGSELIARDIIRRAKKLAGVE